MWSSRRSGIAAAAFALATGAACSKDKGSDERAGAGGDRPAAAAKADPSCAPDDRTGAIGWIEDDLKAAVTCATAQKKPIVIDLWAPWCHTCLSMKSYVFPDPALAPLADRFVWLGADTDREVNADIVAAYPPAAWPTFFVIAPDGKVQGRFVGAASVEQFRDFLVESEKAFIAGEKLDPEDPLARLVAAEHALTEANEAGRGTPVWRDKLQAAEAEYRAALAAAPADWPRRPDVLVSLIGAIAKGREPAACIDFALEHINATGTAASATDFIVNASNCAEALETQDVAKVKQFREAAAARLEGLIADAAAPMSADDRSDAMMNLRFLYDDLGRPTDAAAMAEKQRVFLDDAVAKAPSPFAAMTFAYPRAEVYTYLRKHDEIAPWLEELSKQLPNEYDPPYRLANLYRDAGKLDLAAEWAKKAIALSYGPRKVRAQGILADVYKTKGDAAAELAARKEQLATARALPPGQANPADLQRLEAAITALETTTN